MAIAKYLQDPVKIVQLITIVALLIVISVNGCTSFLSGVSSSSNASSSTLSSLRSGKWKSNGHLRGSLNTVWGFSNKELLQFAVVSDLDRLSKVADADSPTWKSFFKKGKLTPYAGDSHQNIKYKLEWENDIELRTHFGEAGRGMELSELVTWQNKLYTFDDRSGMVFEIDEFHTAIPRYILMEGHGATDKGQKTEWATVKDGVLYVGSFGKEYTKNDGTIKNYWNLWISKIDPNGQITHEDWTKQYDLLREATNSKFPGYMIHEAIHWDDLRRQWIVLPRRVSSDPYDEKLDERKGSNLMIVVNEDFTKVVKTIKVGPAIDLRGWSTFKFIPGTNNELIIALKTEEQENKETGSASQRTFITIFRYEDGEEVLPQTQIPGNHKFEGLEFL